MATPSALDIVLAYAAALSVNDSVGMSALCSSDFTLDLVHRDAFQGGSLPAEKAKEFWQAWIAAFPGSDYELTRTIAGDNVVVTQWICTGRHSGPLESPIFEKRLEPTGRTIRLRGVSIYDVRDGRIERETAYLDLASLMVELGEEL